jgi:KUP system potassium uptake protein
MSSTQTAGPIGETGMSADKATSQQLKRQGLAALTLAAIGVVYGDIGTSPLYTMKAIFATETGVALSPANLIGAVSTIIWALMLVVTFKYVILILRADNRGEGGSLALTAMAAQAVKHKPLLRRVLLLLGVFGATLFYGDGMLTPAISVLGAMEGLEVLTPVLKPYVVPGSVAVLVALFLLQRFGTGAVGKVFGPVISIWFLTLAVIGVFHIAAEPAILSALNPIHAFGFLAERGWYVLIAVGAVVLAITGAEALYADMGHFGRTPIQVAWVGLVLPALALNYMGQGALLMADPGAIENPFFRLFPEVWLIPAIVLATLAAIIASQAVISGAFSMTKQAIQLGFLPRMHIKYTSAREAGQIYMPAVNWALLAGVIVTVLFFGSSSAMATAYGIAVTLTMLITTILTYFLVREGWRLPLPLAVGATAFFVVIDALFVAGCAVKFFDGGWFPLAIGLLLFVLMSTWGRGRTLMLNAIRQDGIALKRFVESLDTKSVQISDRTAVYPVADSETVPQALLHNMKHNQVLHRRNVILTVVFEDVPYIGDFGRVTVEHLGNTFWQVKVHLGFMNTPDIPKSLALSEQHGLSLSVFDTSYFVSRQTVVPSAGEGMMQWRERLFSAMNRNSSNVAEFFRLPDNAVVELGTRVQI